VVGVKISYDKSVREVREKFLGNSERPDKELSVGRAVYIEEEEERIWKLILTQR